MRWRVRQEIVNMTKINILHRRRLSLCQILRIPRHRKRGLTVSGPPLAITRPTTTPSLEEGKLRASGSTYGISRKTDGSLPNLFPVRDYSRHARCFNLAGLLLWPDRRLLGPRARVCANGRFLILIHPRFPSDCYSPLHRDSTSSACGAICSCSSGCGLGCG